MGVDKKSAFECIFVTETDKLSKKIIIIDTDIVFATQAASKMTFAGTKVRRFKRLHSIREVASLSDHSLIINNHGMAVVP